MRNRLFKVLTVILTTTNLLNACGKSNALENSIDTQVTETVTGAQAKITDISYRELSENLDLLHVYDSSELSIEQLQHRNEKIFIEKVIGKVTTDDLDGEVLNYEGDGYYISYENVKDVKVGDIVLTYFVYNPDTNYEDDVMYRYDYVIDHK